MSNKILLIEDDPHLLEGIRLNLYLGGHEVFCAVSGKEGLAIWEEASVDFVILDRMLPDMDGLKVLEKIRKTDESLPILILSAKGEVEDRKAGLRRGCDDYMAKPFDMQELELRMERLLLRGKSIKRTGSRDFFFGDHRIDWERRVAVVDGEDVPLTDQEFRILKYFAENPGKPVSREAILTRALGYAAPVATRTVDNFLVRFRRYFEKNPRKPKFFKSIRSVGYLFDPFGQEKDSRQKKDEENSDTR
ncbi:DNA-binding response OmpR family regulator [Desulfobotulus alkaliphilus]|uniref:DNA-binding response OmpR family regulator n=1 Tax=Desulfobotulus alkaliphilus TaxID=622671 RepID=A0A562S0A7_9BACT|nr:response regulator transcription factor [Desulfobotulus alkaliphilus]TWI74314.1 DNA-binding response OmpR family regulator [Desulfobotulus alkaliphilus]